MEKLSRLNPKTQSFEEGFGGFGAMTVSDLSAALAGADPIGLLIIWRRYISPLERGKGFILLQKESILRVYNADVIPKKKNMLTPLMDECIKDYIGGHVCPFCKGKSEIISDQGKVFKCRSKHCHDGKAVRKDWQRAKALGIQALDYSRNYKSAYKVIDKYLTEVLPEAESKAYNHVMKQANWRE